MAKSFMDRICDLVEAPRELTAWERSEVLTAFEDTMAGIASILNRHGRAATDLVLKFLEHFALISDAIRDQGLWNDEDGFYYDQLRRPDGSVVPVKVRITFP